MTGIFSKHTIFTRFLFTILFTICLCMGCSPAITTATPTATTGPTTTPEPTAIPTTLPPPPTNEPIPTQRTFDYKVIHEENGFVIREAFLGQGAIWQWDTFQMPPSRVKNTVQSLGLGREMACDAQLHTTMPCAQTLSLPRADGGADEYLLRLESINGGSGLLMKNNRLIWTGVTNGANSFAILSSKQMGDEIIFDYSKSNWGTTSENLWMIPSILITRGNTVVQISEAFAPNTVDGKLIYFKIRSKGDVLVFDGKDVGAIYNQIFNLLCCWHGPPIEITSDGKIIDFFAQKDDGWYHVQAGYFKAVP